MVIRWLGPAFQVRPTGYAESVRWWERRGEGKERWKGRGGWTSGRVRQETITGVRAVSPAGVRRAAGRFAARASANNPQIRMPPRRSRTFKPDLEQSDMTHTAGIAPAIRQFYPQLHAGQSEPIAHTRGPTPAITGPATDQIPSLAHRCGNIPATRAMLKTIRRLFRWEVRVER